MAVQSNTPILAGWLVSLPVNGAPNKRAQWGAVNLVPLAVAGIMLLAAHTYAAEAPGFEARCEKLARETAISVGFEDRVVSTDSGRSLADLKGLSAYRSNPSHNVLGLTHAEPTARLEASTQQLASTDGRVCAIPALKLTLGFSALEILLAKELTDPCRRKIVEMHERAHVAAWRSHLRVGAKLLEGVLRSRLALPRYADDPAVANEEMKQHINDVLEPLLQRLKEGAVAANQEIDSPAAHQYEEQQVRACP